MNVNIKKIDRENEKIIDCYDYMANAATTQDCTGLIPGNPIPGDNMEAYEDIYHYGPPKTGPKVL